MKILRVTKTFKEIKFEGTSGKLEGKKKFLETVTHKISEANFSFHVKERTTGKV